MADTKITRQIRERSRAQLGLCVRCGKRDQEPELRFCRLCLDDSARKTKIWYGKRDGSKLCNVCGERPKLHKRKSCAACRSKKMRERRLLARSGVCNACLTHKPAKGYKSCQRCRDIQERHRKRLRNEVLGEYGSKCVCCGETEKGFLTIDHIEQKRPGEPKRLASGGALLLSRLKRDGYPDGFQVLCRNCNWGKYINEGVCPHRVAA